MSTVTKKELFKRDHAGEHGHENSAPAHNNAEGCASDGHSRREVLLNRLKAEKRKQTKTEAVVPCYFYRKGWCMYGKTCHYRHSIHN